MTTTRGTVYRWRRITRRMVRDNPNTLFCFGDNMEGRGLGGQAGEMRGEPNAVGVPTKWRPSRDEGAYFTDEDWLDKDVRNAIQQAFLRLWDHLEAGGDVVVPADGLGTGLAELPRRAPIIHRHIRKWIEALERGPEPE